MPFRLIGYLVGMLVATSIPAVAKAETWYAVVGWHANTNYYCDSYAHIVTAQPIALETREGFLSEVDKNSLRMQVIAYFEQNYPAEFSEVASKTKWFRHFDIFRETPAKAMQFARDAGYFETSSRNCPGPVYAVDMSSFKFVPHEGKGSIGRERLDYLRKLFTGD